MAALIAGSPCFQEGVGGATIQPLPVQRTELAVGQSYAPTDSIFTPALPQLHCFQEKGCLVQIQQTSLSISNVLDPTLVTPVAAETR